MTVNLLVGGKTVRKWRDAISRADCLSEAEKMGHDPDTAQRICDTISDDVPNAMDKVYPGDNENDKQAKAAANEKMIAQCAKMKMKKDPSLSEDDATQACEDAFSKSAWLDPNQMSDDDDSEPTDNEPGSEDDSDNDNDNDSDNGNGDDNDNDNDVQADYTEGLGYGKSETNFDLGNDGPKFDSTASLDDNDHINTHMSDSQKQMGDNLADMSPGMSDSDSDSDSDSEDGEDDDEDDNGGIPELPDQPTGTTTVKTVMPDFRGPIIAGKTKHGISYKNAQVEPFESNGHFFVKAFLLDTSLNQNNWGVSPTTLDANINSYVGKPLVLTENFDHPDSGDPDLNHALLYQELYRIGTIVDVVKKGTRYDAVAEITDPYAIDAWQQGQIPLYVSPQLYKNDPGESDSAITKWQGTHLALVKDPAFGVKVAQFGGSCTGDPSTCLAQLKKASIIEKHGYGSCGYCNRKLLLSAKVHVSPLQHSQPQNSPKVNYPPGHEPPQESRSSLEPKSETSNRNKTLPESKSSSSAVAELEAANKKIASLEQKLAISLKSNQEKDSVNTDLAKRMAALETELRRDKVAAILSAAGQNNEERINSLTKSNLPLEEITSIYQPYVEAKQVSPETTTTTKSAAKPKEVQYVESKVTMKNAATEPGTTGQPIQKPAWLSTRDYLMEGYA